MVATVFADVSSGGGVPTELVLASHNKGKLAELQALLAPLGLTLRSAAEFGLEAPDEPYPTFVENALTKARYVAKATGLAALADDSGLCVDVLGGAPGVQSSRYAALALEQAQQAGDTALVQAVGSLTGDAANNAVLLHTLAQCAADPSLRHAHFTSWIVLVRHADDPEPLIAKGHWPGVIADAPSGEHGFGYDPLFVDPATGLSAAQMTRAQKNAVSHRGRALRDLVSQLTRMQQGQALTATDAS